MTNLRPIIDIWEISKICPRIVVPRSRYVLSMYCAQLSYNQRYFTSGSWEPRFAQRDLGYLSTCLPKAEITSACCSDLMNSERKTTTHMHFIHNLYY